MIPATYVLEVYGDRGTIDASSTSRTYRVQSLDADGFPWSERLAGLTPVRGDDGWWAFDVERVRAPGLSSSAERGFVDLEWQTWG